MFDSSGRTANETMTLPVAAGAPWIGVKPLFSGSLAEGADARFEVIGLDAGGRPAAIKGLRWDLVEEIHDYQWFSTDGHWDYKVVTRDRKVADGTADVAPNAPAAIRQAVGWGNFRLDVYDPKGGGATSARFYAGWWVSDDPNPTPDKLTVALDRTSYKAGDTARVRIEPPFAGDVLLFIANDRVLETRDVAVPADGATVEIPVSSDWGAGAYVLATAFRPSGEGGERRHGPGRAVGVAWFGIDVTERVLGVSIDAPAEIRPNQRLDLPLTVTGVPQGQSAWVTLAAVDEGILLLTDFQSPDPTDHYFGRRALGVEMRDAYGRLIISDGRRGQVRTGGDAAAQQMSGLPKRSTRTVALYSGILPVGADGRVTVPLDLPDFDGELRLMAVAWTPTALGAASTAMKVRDPVIAEIGVPRFLAPGDKADLAFSLRNLSGPAGDYGVRVAVEGPLSIATASAQFTQTVAAGAEARRAIPLTATATGVGKIRISVTGPDGFQRDRDWDLSVRPAQALTTDRIATLVQPNQSVVLNADLVKGFLPDTVQVFASFSTRPTFDIPGLLKALDDYPYGCVEQTTSRALPLLYVAKVAEKVDSGFRPNDVRRKVQGAIDRIMTAQQPARRLRHVVALRRGQPLALRLCARLPDPGAGRGRLPHPGARLSARHQVPVELPRLVRGAHRMHPGQRLCALRGGPGRRRRCRHHALLRRQLPAEVPDPGVPGADRRGRRPVRRHGAHRQGLRRGGLDRASGELLRRLRLAAARPCRHRGAAARGQAAAGRGAAAGRRRRRPVRQGPVLEHPGDDLAADRGRRGAGRRHAAVARGRRPPVADPGAIYRLDPSRGLWPPASW